MWQYEAEDGTHDMFMDLEEEVRFRVVQETFVDTLPTDGENPSCWKLGQHGCPHDCTKIACIEGQSKISLHVIVSVQPHSAGKAAEGASGAVITATTDSGPQQAPYTIIVSDLPCTQVPSGK